MSEQDRHSPDRLTETNHAVVRTLGVVALAGISVIHLVQLVPTFRSTPLLGVAFVLLIVAGSSLAIWLVGAPRRTSATWIAVTLFSLSAILGYILTRVVSTPLDNQDVGNWSCMLGMVALYVEALLGLLAVYALTTLKSTRIGLRILRLTTSVEPDRRAEDEKQVSGW
jgi:FtsH-binding integral membrane protein